MTYVYLLRTIFKSQCQYYIYMFLQENFSISKVLQQFLGFFVLFTLVKLIFFDGVVLEVYYGSQIPVNIGGFDLRTSYLQYSYHKFPALTYNIFIRNSSPPVVTASYNHKRHHQSLKLVFVLSSRNYVDPTCFFIHFCNIIKLREKISYSL